MKCFVLRNLAKCVVVSLIVFGIAWQTASANTKLNFNQVDIKEFIKFAADYAGLNLVYNVDNVKGKITVYSPGDASREDVLQILDTILEIYGYAAARDGNMLILTANTEAPRYAGAAVGAIEEASGTQVMFLRTTYLAIADVVNLIKPIVSARAYIAPIPNRNMMMIVDNTTNVMRVKSLLAKLDNFADDNRFETLSPQHYSSFDMAERLKLLFPKAGIKDAVIMPLREENRLYIYGSAQEVATLKRLSAQMDQAFIQRSNGVYVTPLKFANSEEVVKVLTAVFKELTSAGKPVNFTADLAINAVVVNCEQTDYDNIRQVIEKLDQPQKQVYIEALVIETSVTHSDAFGVSWTAGGGDNNNVALGSSNMSGAGVSSSAFATELMSGKIPSVPAGLSLGFIGNSITYQGFTFPTITALVNALKTKSYINILSNPKILTINNQEAEIFVGENRPYVTSEKFDSNNNPIQTYEYKDVGIRLRVKPQISQDGMVKHNIYQEIIKVAAQSASSTQPITLKRSTNTNVMVPDANTIVISGLIDNDTNTVKQEVPCLVDLPVLGYAFRNTSGSTDKKNLLVFVTPYIVNTAYDSDIVTKTMLDRYDDFYQKIYQDVFEITPEIYKERNIVNPATEFLNNESR
ncbi:secretin N-terminal domain-containing protein [Chrysiogenes arsenatis]|uniref:secretin N-terminal domain-containing protein n=1 Tax=Chrysiogenes arsenatis TaxID=309797 RepID=UPI000426F76A|nr:secretin N-terminal domain-containing protein [Chrysiogenes arsenatis]